MSRKPSSVTEGRCPQCDKVVTGEWEDCGIGAYEYWGAHGVHHDWHCFCPECGEELEDTETYDIEPDYDPTDDLCEDPPDYDWDDYDWDKGDKR